MVTGLGGGSKGAAGRKRDFTFTERKDDGGRAFQIV
jgi:hypothetical protein